MAYRPSSRISSLVRRTASESERAAAVGARDVGVRGAAPGRVSSPAVRAAEASAGPGASSSASSESEADDSDAGSSRASSVSRACAPPASSSDARCTLVMVGGVGSESRRERLGVRFGRGVPTTLLRRAERGGEAASSSWAAERNTSSTASRAASLAGVCAHRLCGVASRVGMGGGDIPCGDRIDVSFTSDRAPGRSGVVRRSAMPSHACGRSSLANGFAAAALPTMLTRGRADDRRRVLRFHGLDDVGTSPIVTEGSWATDIDMSDGAAPWSRAGDGAARGDALSSRGA